MKSSSNRAPTGGFTLIELIVTMSILSIILTLAAQVTISASDSIRLSEGRSLHDTEARRFFVQIERDISEIIIRQDARIEFESKPGNDRIAFLTRRRGYTSDDVGDRLVSLVVYEHDASQVVRGSRGHQFSESGNEALNLDPDIQFPAITANNLQSVSNNIFRIEFEYLIEGTNQVTLEVTPPATSEKLRGIVVTIATLDDRGHRAVGDQRLVDLSTRFPDSTTNVRTLESWTQTRDDLAGTGIPGVPRDILTSLRCYQRTFIIP